MSEPEKADLDELWTALEPHIEWPEGLTLILLFADNPAPINDLRERAESLVRDSGRTLFMLAPQTVDQLSSVLGSVLVRPADQVRALWIELWRGSGGAGWDHAVGDILQRLNERRAALERVLRRPTVLVLPTSFRTRVHVLAPDLWTIRSFTADLPSPRAETHVPSASELPVRPTFALPPPSAEEKEWTRLLATGEHDRIDAWDGLQALDAALRRGSLVSARHIAQQVVTLLVRGEVGDDASLMTTDEVLQSLQGADLGESRNLLAAVSGLGDVEVQAGNLAAARHLFQRVLDLSERLASSNPHDIQALRDLSISLVKLGDIAVHLSTARDMFQRSLDVSEQLASADPNSDRAKRDLSVSLDKLGDIEIQAGNISAARALFQRSLDICEQLASTDPHSTQAQRDIAVSLNALGNLEVQTGNLPAARSLFQRSLNLLDQLASADPHSARALRDLAVSLGEFGDVELQTGNISTARSLFQRSLELFEQLASTDPHNAQAQLDLIRAHSRFIELGGQLEDIKMQRDHLHAGNSLLASLATHGVVDNSADAQALAQHLETVRARLERSDPRPNPP